jgi:hypothetical protein
MVAYGPLMENPDLTASPDPHRSYTLAFISAYQRLKKQGSLVMPISGSLRFWQSAPGLPVVWAAT